LLDTGPLVALLSRTDANHARARAMFSACAPPLRCCEAVIAEACFLMRRVHRLGPVEVVSLGAQGVYTVALSLDAHWTRIEALLRKYADRPVSLADACLIACAEVYEEPHILTFDSDFDVYRWAGSRRFTRVEG
jgi:predicted nucleic acid-binding protein